MIGWLALAVVAMCGHSSSAARTVEFKSKCPKDVWIMPEGNDNAPAPAPGLAKLPAGGSLTYNMPDAGWKGRFSPKTGCDGSGQNCQTGQTKAPCPPKGCQAPALTIVEFNFQNLATKADATTWYDISLVDGYNVNMEIVPSKIGGSCVTTNCNVRLDACPTDEISGLGNLLHENIQCLSPCKKWNYPAPYGMGKSETVEPGLHLCCPHPPIESADCNAGLVSKTKYVSLIHKECPSAYAFSYDDLHALHTCSADTSFTVYVC